MASATTCCFCGLGLLQPFYEALLSRYDESFHARPNARAPATSSCSLTTYPRASATLPHNSFPPVGQMSIPHVSYARCPATAALLRSPIWQLYLQPWVPATLPRNLITSEALMSIPTPGAMTSAPALHPHTRNLLRSLKTTSPQHVRAASSAQSTDIFTMKPDFG